MYQHKKNSMKKLTKTQILLIGSLTFLVAVTSGYSFFFIAMKEKTDSTGELFAKMEELSGRNSKLAAAVDVLKNEARRVEKLKSYFIKESEIVVFAKNIEMLGIQAGVTLSLASLDPGIGDTNTPVINFSIKATGKFEEVMHVITLLENSSTTLEWKSIRLLRENDGAIPVVGKDAPQATNKEPRWLLEATVVAVNFIHE